MANLATLKSDLALRPKEVGLDLFDQELRSRGVDPDDVALSTRRMAVEKSLDTSRDLAREAAGLSFSDGKDWRINFIRQLQSAAKEMARSMRADT